MKNEIVDNHTAILIDNWDDIMIERLIFNLSTYLIDKELSEGE